MVSVCLSERRNSPRTEKVIKFDVVDLIQLNFGYQEKTITHSYMKTCYVLTPGMHKSQET